MISLHVNEFHENKWSNQLSLMTARRNDPREAPHPPLLHVVLFQPEIPQNTGNIGRTCLAIGAKLWLIRPLGFHLDEKHLKRAGMDYWPQVNCEVVDDWQSFLTRCPSRRIWCLTKFASRLVWEADFERGDVLLFGSESQGLPSSIRDADPSKQLKLPMLEQVRSLNLASSATAVMYEAVRQFGGLSY